jgi:hypothetical protein
MLCKISGTETLPYSDRFANRIFRMYEFGIHVESSKFLHNRRNFVQKNVRDISK